MSDFLFLFSITPVQSYIEQARKTQDLYAGSQILSHLCRTAIEASGLTPKQIIFPNYDPKSSDSGYCLPNRFLAIVAKEEHELKHIGKQVQRAVNKEFFKIAHTVIINHKHKKMSRSEWNQIRKYLTINWVFVPVNGDYKTAYTQIERYLGAIKQVRTFEQLEETGRKCGTCGERNIRFYRKTEKESEDKQPLIPKKLFISEEKDVTVWKYHECSPKFLQDGEGLCAVCYAKRVAEEFLNFDNNFTSTGEIALFDAIRQLKKPSQKWLEISYDPHVVFDLAQHRTQKVEDSKKSLKKSTSRYAHKMLQDIKNAEQLWNELHDQDIKVSPYYALLRFDGDSMGKWLSGDNLTKDSNLFEFHKALSERLRDFAENTKLSPSEGRIVYIGGDDFLGFVTLKNLFPVLQRLRDNFRTTVHQKLFETPTHFALKDTQTELTFSAGVVVAHFKTPLAEVLKWSRMMEEEAKHIDPDKNAFALAVLKHSGEITKTTWKWNIKSYPITGFLRDIIEKLQEQQTTEWFSNTFIANISREFAKLIEDGDEHDGTYTDTNILRTELERLLDRSCHLARQTGYTLKEYQDRKRATVQQISKPLMAMFDASKDFKQSLKYSLTNLFTFLHIADFLARTSSVQADIE